MSEKNQKNNIVEQSEPLVVEHQLKGLLDGCDAKGICGWVMDENNLDDSVEIDIFIDGEVIIRTIANIFREDLLAAGIRDGKCAFDVSIPEEFFDGEEHNLEIKDVLSGLLLDGFTKNFSIPPIETLIGCLDVCGDKGIKGWVMDEANPDQPIEVDILIDETLIARIVANIFRQDLMDSGIGDGKHGFDISVPAEFFNGEEHKVEVYEALTGKLLQCFVASFIPDVPFINNDLIQEVDQIGILGSVEYVYSTLIYGWAFSQDKRPLNFSVLINNREYFQKVNWLERHDIAEKYGKDALYSHFKITPSDSLKAVMFEESVKNEDIIVLVNGLELPKTNEIVLNSSGLKLAVVIHAYYENQLELINDYLQNINCYFDLFITVPENVVEKLRPTIDRLFFRRELRVVKNIGNDVAPFLDLVSELDKQGYDLVCKLHTKRNHEKYKEYWRDCLLDGVVGSQSLVDDIIHSFKKDSQLDLVGPALMYSSVRMNIYDGGDKLRTITNFLLKPGQEIDDWGFFAGTMFWARVSMFRPLQNTTVRNELPFSKPQSNNESMDSAQLLERVFGLLPHISQGKVGLVDYKLANGQYLPTFRVLDQQITPRSSFVKNIYIFELMKKGYLPEWSALNYYNFLDKRWYFIENPEIISPKTDCILDFLTKKDDNTYLNQEHEEYQTNIRFEVDAIYLDIKNEGLSTSVNWPEVLASEIFFPSAKNIVKTKKIKSDIKVSVICVTYNHEKYIRQALEGFVNQKTNFRFEVIIGDDASTDSTQKIISEYVEKFPDIFIPVLRSENIGSRDNFLDLCSRIKGEFVAVNDGDDYWENLNKLQIQVDYFDVHPKCTLCFHAAKVINEIEPKKISIFPIDLEGEIFTTDNIVERNFIQSNTVMYRWGFHDGFGDDYNLNALPRDLYRHSLHAALGEIHFIPKVMSVYRRNLGGMFSSFTDNIELVKKWGIGHIELFRTLDIKFNYQYTENYLSKELSLIRTLIPEYWQDANFDGFANIAINYSDTTQIVFNELNININLHNVKDELGLKRELENNYKISVLVTSYNHVLHLSTSLDNILSQQGFFFLEVIVADDDSSDGTRKIAEDYATRYPEIIRVLPKTSNMGMLKNMERGFSACTGNFIAICEGDDYWLSKMKLHKQLWMLICRPELSMCFNWLLLYYEEEGKFIPHPGQGRINKDTLTFEDLSKEPLTGNFSCCLYQTKTIRKIPKQYFNEERAADWLFNICAASNGDIGFLKETLSVYRIHAKGQWSGLNKFEMNERRSHTKLQFHSYFPEKFTLENEKLIKKRASIDESSIVFNLQNIEIKYNCLFIDGWIFDKNEASVETEDKFFIVKDTHNRVVYRQLMENKKRNDVDKAFSKDEKGRYLWAGFASIFSEAIIKSGKYILWIGFSTGSIPIKKLLVLEDGTCEVKVL